MTIGLLVPAILWATLLSPAASFPSQAEATRGGRAVTEIDPRVWYVHERENGELWFGTNGAGVFRLRGDLLTQFTEEHGLTGNQVRGLQSDGRGGVLVAAKGGVARLNGGSFRPLPVVEHAGSEGWRLKPQDVWFAADIGTAGVFRFDGEVLHKLDLGSPPRGFPVRSEGDPAWWDPSGVYRVTEDRRGHVWVGTAGAGLCRYDGESIDWMFERPLTETPSGGSFGIRSIFEDSRGDYWICNTRQRFQMQAEAREGRLVFTRTPGLPDAAQDDAANFTYFHDVVEDDQRRLWMTCGSDGVLRLDGDEVAHFSLGEDVYALSILIDSSRGLWVGTVERGVWRWNGEGFVLFSPGLSSGR